MLFKSACDLGVFIVIFSPFSGFWTWYPFDDYCVTKVFLVIMCTLFLVD